MVVNNTTKLDKNFVFKSLQKELKKVKQLDLYYQLYY